MVVRAGQESLHPQWLNAGQNRSWDLIVSVYDPAAYFDHAGDVTIVQQNGGKWDGLYPLFAHSDLMSRYDYVWLPDDDISIASAGIDLIFDAMRLYDLDVGQPSLTHDSHHSHFICMTCPGFRLRYTNFVEIMAPCLKTSLLRLVLDDFQDTMSGFGLDYIWCRLSEAALKKAAIFDTIVVRHTRPIGHSLRRNMADKGFVAEEEEKVLRAKYRVNGRIRPLVYEAIDDRGRILSGSARLGWRMAWRYLRAYWKRGAHEIPFCALLKLLRRQVTRRPNLSKLRRHPERDRRARGDCR